MKKHLLTTLSLRLFPAVLAVLTATGLSAAHAGTISYSGYGVSNEANVHITDLALGVNNEYGGAGLISLTGSGLSVYCVDIAAWLLSSGTYNAGVNPAGNVNLAGKSSLTGNNKLTDIAALIAHGSNTAAVQIAIWQTEYGSAVSITPDDANLTTLASSYITDLHGDWTAPTGLYLNELTPNGAINQTMVYLAPTTPIPEPATLVIVGSALAMIGVVRKRRQRRLQRCTEQLLHVNNQLTP